MKTELFHKSLTARELPDGMPGTLIRAFASTEDHYVPLGGVLLYFFFFKETSIYTNAVLFPLTVTRIPLYFCHLEIPLNSEFLGGKSLNFHNMQS